MSTLDRLEALEREATNPRLHRLGAENLAYVAALRNAAPALLAVARAAEYECEHLGGSEGLLNAVARLNAEAPE